MTHPPRGRRLTIVVVALLSIIFTACSTGAASNDGVASLSSPGAAAPTSSPEASLDAEDAMLAYAQCMRDNGIDMPDPQAGGGFVRIGGPGEGGIDPQSEEFQAAQEACGSLLEGAGFGGRRELSQEELDRMVEFAQCMRDNGIDMPDPQADGGVRVQIRGQAGVGGAGPGGVDPGSDEFQAAFEACQDLMPFGPGGGPATDEVDGSGGGSGPSVEVQP
jgi:hypothetical protein